VRGEEEPLQTQRDSRGVPAGGNFFFSPVVAALLSLSHCSSLSLRPATFRQPLCCQTQNPLGCCQERLLDRRGAKYILVNISVFYSLCETSAGTRAVYKTFAERERYSFQIEFTHAEVNKMDGRREHRQGAGARIRKG
jgi:hypothetical protein